MNDDEIRAIVRPHPNLLKMYFLQALATLFAFPVVMLPLYFKFHTLRYKIDDEGVTASWGLLFRREIYLTYKRIQDIHVKRNIFERWLGIGTVAVQTAAGSATAELSLEGMSDYAAVRDFLYRHMRGHEHAGAAPAAELAPAGGAAPEADPAVALLEEIRVELEGARRALEQRGA